MHLMKGTPPLPILLAVLSVFCKSGDHQSSVTDQTQSRWHEKEGCASVYLNGCIECTHGRFLESDALFNFYRCRCFFFQTVSITALKS